MRALREKDFDEMAGRIVDRFMAGGTKLADATVDEAMGGQLNPDQIERLVQAANTMAFLRMMEARKAQGAPDLMHEFDPVDTRGVLQHIIGQTDPGMGAVPMGPHDEACEPPHAEPDGDEGPLPDEMSAHRMPHPPMHDEAAEHGLPPGTPVPPHDEAAEHAGPKAPPIDADNDGPFPKGEKQKAKDDSDKPKKKEPAKAKEKDEEKEAALLERRMRKLADLLDDQFLQAELTFEAEYEKLSHQLKLAHAPATLDGLEKDAMSIDAGEHSVIVLNLLREERGLAPLEHSGAREKHAALADRHVAQDTPALRQFERLVKIAHDADKLRRAAAVARSRCS